MKNIMKVSLVLLSVPILFSGCMQEKVSKISPESKDKNNTKTSKQEIKTLESISSKPKILQVKNDSTYINNNGVKLIPNTNQDNLNIDSTVLDELTFNIQNDIDINSYENQDLSTEALEAEENWVAFTREDEILETAKEYLGVPYIWAANGPSAFDCSGYTRYIFRKNGITIPRYSGHQANVGLKVVYNELQKGDLVFFDTSKGFHKRVNHVGIYMGDNQFIHASSAGKRVMITSFSQKKFYKNRFLYGRRLINNDTSFASYDSSETIYTN